MTGVGLILPAAGSGSRCGASQPKQIRMLAGRPVCMHALHAFHGLVDAAVIPVADAVAGPIADALAADDPGFPTRLVAGGADRRASVAAGIAALDPALEVILVHDAARPLVTPTMIAGCIAAVRAIGAAVVCRPCPDSIKRAGADATTVGATVPRTGLYLAQTPQGFRRERGAAAYARAAAEGWQVTDDAEILERAGHPVAIVAGDARNFKITTPDDLDLAEALLAHPGERRSPIAPS